MFTSKFRQGRRSDMAKTRFIWILILLLFVGEGFLLSTIYKRCPKPEVTETPSDITNDVHNAVNEANIGLLQKLQKMNDMTGTMADLMTGMAEVKGNPDTLSKIQGLLSAQEKLNQEIINEISPLPKVSPLPLVAPHSSDPFQE